MTAESKIEKQNRNEYSPPDFSHFNILRVISEKYHNIDFDWTKHILDTNLPNQNEQFPIIKYRQIGFLLLNILFFRKNRIYSSIQDFRFVEDLAEEILTQAEKFDPKYKASLIKDENQIENINLFEENENKKDLFNSVSKNDVFLIYSMSVYEFLCDSKWRRKKILDYDIEKKFDTSQLAKKLQNISKEFVRSLLNIRNIYKFIIFLFLRLNFKSFLLLSKDF